MKNGLIIWNIVLTLLVGYLLIARKGSRTTKSSGTEIAVTDTTSAGYKEVRIAYFEMDSVAAQVEEVKQLQKELAKRDADNNNELNRLTKEFRDKYDYYQKLAQEGKLSADQSQSASEEMKRMDDAIKNRKMQLEQDYSDFMVRVISALTMKIPDPIIDPATIIVPSNNPSVGLNPVE